MTHLEPDEAKLFGRARRGLSPSALDQQRVLLALGSAPAAASVTESSPKGSKLASWGRIGSGVAALALAVAAGYGWGYQAGSRDRPLPVVVEVPVAAPAADSSQIVFRAPSQVRAPTPATSLDRASTPKTTSSVASAAAPTPAPPAAGLDEEVRQLRRIERAIRDGNPRLALAIGDNLDREIPGGQLLLERRAARLMASCQLDAATGAAPAAGFLSENPDSAYGLRLREICGLAPEAQRNGAASGTHAVDGGAR
jgi:hypothetical protein